MSTKTAISSPPHAIEQQPIALSAQGLHISFGQVQAVAGVSLSIPLGQIIAILGPNGAGKSSLIALFLGLNRPDQGHTEIFGYPAGSMAAKQRLGVMLQQAELADNLIVDELLELFRNYYRQPLSRSELIQAAGLEGFHQRRYGKLSGGEKRRVQFALALAGDPNLLFLDEPTTGLDLSARRQLWQRIRAWAAQGRSIVLTTHYLEEAEQLAERIIVMNAGQIIADTTPQQLQSDFRRVRVRCCSQLAMNHPLWGELAQAPEVHEFHHHPCPEGLQIELISSQPETIARHLLAADAQLSALEINGAGLEAAFLALTKTEGIA